MIIPLPIPKTVFVDVDGTLDIYGELNQPLIDFILEKKQEGFTITLWSMAGKDHALKVAEEYKVTDVFDNIITKPGIIIDDKGTQWIHNTIVLDQNLE